MKYQNFKTVKIRNIKKIFLLFVFLSTLSIQLFGNNLKPSIDKRVELMSIIFRLAGGSAYNSNYAKKYISQIDSYFEPFKNDTLIGFTKEILHNGMSADGVMTLAVNFELKNGQLKLTKNWKKHISPRWMQVDMNNYVFLLNSFYKKSNFEIFFNNQKLYYQEVVEAFDNSIPPLNSQWFFDFYGEKSKKNFNIIIGCNNGTYSYGPTSQGENGENIYAIIGNYNFDDETNNPYFDSEYDFSTLIHEFNHPFLNPIFYRKNFPELEKSSVILFDSISEIGQLGNRDGNTLLIESLVRMAVVQYFIDNNYDNEKIKIEIANQMELGYIWLNNMVSLFDVYKKNRTTYPTLASFFLTISSFFNQTVENINNLKSSFEVNRPKVIDIQPFENNSRTVASSCDKVILNFNHKVFGDFGGFFPGSLGDEGVPKFTSYDFINEREGLRLSFELEPKKEYEFIVYLSNLRDENGFSLKDYLVKFTTK